ncbi:hypothetical protein IDJ75_11740 [Mucilaginibacter rigui]|uniref:TIGR04222 domain-containing membrane protein n=1 Tax=Mucilaginibacter rigui TaxID=534635 RepID=A0ABR7X5U2_9SPHI|nr:hypothetical protein [Mucilaginibacter rigui]MBD1385954.1 hypothetical protein [Mucilaginibacter rigui]
MELNEQKLWQKIHAFELDEPGSAFKFSDRLARENGWTKSYAKRVVEEYKKFIFLCCVSQQGVTPSDPVDQAWHLHLTFTRSYWTDLCKNTLNREIHHNPTKGGEQEAAKFDGFYTGSQKLYAEKFGQQPPSDIWHDNHTRFSDINFQRVNTGRYWMVKKPRFSVYSLVLLMLFIASTIFIQASDTILSAILMLGIITVIIIAVYKWESDPDRWKNNDDDRTGGGCSTAGSGCNSHHGGQHGGHYGGGDSGCGSGCSGCSSSGCSGCGGGGD